VSDPSSARAIVVGAGPNGLAAAVVLAQSGLDVTVVEASDEIGGGTKTSELTIPGLLHDHCSAVHPMGVGSPLLQSLGLERYGLQWAWPEVDLAHPLDGGRAGVMVRSLDATVDGLGRDGVAWRRVFGPLAESFDSLNDDLLQPVLGLPSHPVQLARFGLRAAMPAALLARRFRTDEARALFLGVAAHALSPLTGPLSSSVGAALVAAGHRHGWPVAKGGSRSITAALATLLQEHAGAVIETGVRVASLDDLPPSDVVLLDLTPSGAADVLGDAMPSRIRRAFRRWEHGPGAFKVDLAVEGGVPWTHPSCRRAGTVHVGGSPREVVQAERDVNRGRMPERPFVLVSQQYLADPSRSVGDIHPVWAYAHVPHGWDGDATEAVLTQLERFAPGTRERVVAMSVRSTEQFEQDNANYVGGDIVNGANSVTQLALRPRATTQPYSTGVPGVYLCSAATPPGAGVHGMCGANAAHAALDGLRAGSRRTPRHAASTHG
jgi:phytoene dehydrogenase-like protein